jgi:hypothetical protein
MNGATNDERVLLINVLNTMYNDNMRQIQNLNSSNNEIRNVLVSTILNSQPRNTNNNSNINRNTNSNINRNTNSNINRNTNSNINRNTNSNINRNTNSNINRNTYNRNNTSISNQNGRIPYTAADNIQNNVLDRYLNSSRLYTSLPLFRNRQSTREDLTRTLGSFFDPVVINPTQAQIELATRNVMYCDIVTPMNRSCPISLETFNDADTVTIIRYCGHIFNTEEIRRWFTTSCRCPICRYDIRNYNSNSLFNNSTQSSESESPALGAEINSSNTNEQERNPINAPIDRYLYSFITSDISGNTTDTTAILSLLTAFQGSM